VPGEKRLSLARLSLAAHKAGDTAVGHPEAKADLEIATRLFPECRTMVCVAPARVGIVIDFAVLISRLSSAT
jgi:hypothetical protein